MSLQMCHVFVHNLRAIQHDSSHHFIHPNSSRRSIRQDSIPRESTTCQWHKPVPFALIPQFPSMFLTSSFQDLKYPFSRFYLCMSLWHLWILCSHSWFLGTVLWIFLGSLYSFLCLRLEAHSRTMTCSDCLCQTIACRCSCLHCILVENVLHRT